MPPRRKRKQTTSKHSVTTATHAAETTNASSIQPAAEGVAVLPVEADVEPVKQATKKSKTDGADAVVQEEEKEAAAAQEPVVAEEARKLPPRRKRKQTTGKHSVKTATHAAETANASSIQPAAEEVTVLPVVADVEPVEQSSKKSKTDGSDAVVQEEEETTAPEPVVAEEAPKLAKLLHGDEAERDQEDAEESKLSPEDNSFVVATAAAVAAQALAAGEVVDHDICQIALKDDPPPLKKVKKIQDEAEFQAMLVELTAYKLEHGDLFVPNKYPTNMKLSAWVKHQKAQYKLFKEGNESESQLTADRVKQLEAIGFLWPLPTKLDEKWSYRLQELIKFKEEHGHCRVPDKFPVNPQLATWVSTQRVQFRLFKEGKKASMITPARIEALNEIGFDWGREGCSDLVDWEVRYEELSRYKEENGHCRVPRAYKENPQLGNWVHTQRKQYKLFMEKKTSLINAERVAALGRLGFSWSLRSTPDKVDWDLRLAELLEFKKEHGDLLVPRKYQKNEQLGTWVQTQREQYKLLKNGLPSHMTEDRIEKLEAIGGWVWIARDRVDWDVRLSELQKYKQEHGNCLVPYRYPPNPQLGGWVRTQREQYKLLKEGKISHMTQDRIVSLDELGFVWSLHEKAKQGKKMVKAPAKKKAKKKRGERRVASDIISSAIAASIPEISDAATSAAVEAAAAVASANSAEVGQEIATLTAVGLENTAVEDIAGDDKGTKEFAEGVVENS